MLRNRKVLKKTIVVLPIILASIYIPLPAVSECEIQGTGIRFSSNITLGCTLRGVYVGLSCSADVPVNVLEHIITPSVGWGISYYSNFLDLGKQGWETCLSGQLSIMHDSLLVSLGSNFWNGLNDLHEFAQQTGIISVQLRDVGTLQDQTLTVSYENDGAPFHLIKLADFMDRYRTAGVRIAWTNDSERLAVSSKFTCFTGLRDKSQEHSAMMNPIVDEFGNQYPYGYVCEIGFPYRYSCIELNVTKDSVTYAAFLHHDIFRHIFQDLVAHSLLDPRHQGGFPSLSNTLTTDLGVRVSSPVIRCTAGPDTPYSLF